MENRPIIKKEQVETVYDSRFIKVFDLQYEPGKHYFDATRRAKDNLAAVERRRIQTDAAGCSQLRCDPEDQRTRTETLLKP